jgi:Holliday junction DNA helicase RuvA
MIARVEGRVVAHGADYVVLAVGGIGLRIWVPATLASQCASESQRVELHTHLHVRENELALYGFATPQDCALFETLISVSGVGPRLALALLDGVPAPTLHRAVAQNMPDLLTHVPGVGRKTAQRLILELKGKLGEAALGLEEAPLPVDMDAISALTALGYSVAEARRALQSIPDRQSMSVDEVILAALRQLGE